MKLKEDAIVQSVADTVFLVPVGAEAFSGIARSNKTAGFILEMLKEETTKEQIVDAMAEKYDASKETIAADLEEILDKLRELNVLDE